ncbi:unnamed protein product [Effrenium voratum]|nr:unnamed protein product [Effrenium voratum]
MCTNSMEKAPLGVLAFICLICSLAGSEDPHPLAAVLAALLGWLSLYAYMLQAECQRLSRSPVQQASVDAEVGCVSQAFEHGAALGWSLHGPALCSGLRLSLLLVLFLLGRASRGSDRTRTWNILRQVFPYAVYVPLTGLCVARVVTDPPPETPSGALFWLALVLSFLCGAAEDRLTLQAPRARAENETELLETPSAADAAGEGEAESRRKKDSLWKLLDLVLLEWPLLIQAGICLMVAAIADVLIPHYISQTISLIILAEEQGTLASRPYKQPVLCLLLAAATSAVFSAMRGGTFIVIGGRLGVTLRCRLLETLTRQEIGFFDTTKIGELTSRMTQDCQQVVDQAYLNVNVFLRTLVSIITTIAFMFSITVPLTMVAFVSVPCVVIVCMKYSEIFRQISEKAQESLADANAVANESLGNMSTVRSFAAEGLEVRRFATAMAVYRRLMKRRGTFYLCYVTSTMMLPQVVTALILFYGGKLAMTGEVHASSLLSFVFYLQTLNSNFSILGDFYTNMVQAAGAAVRVFELCERQAEGPSAGTCEVSAEKGELRLRNLHFSYPARPEVKILKGLNLDIPGSQVVALVGPSGNGKSTVIGLVKRLYHASEGEITLDGIPIWDYSHAHFHRVISIVGQEPVLFARSVRDNILLGLVNPKQVAGERIPELPGCQDLAQKDIEELARKANAHDFICAMPQGYDSEVGERGVQLSGGQKQRIAIARALARQPKVLLLDEATSALDAESEFQVQRAIDAMIAEGSMTVVIIAHRLSTVKNSHKICVIKGGQVVEEGSHEALLAARGAYFQLVECQLNGDAKAASQ